MHNSISNLFKAKRFDHELGHVQKTKKLSPINTHRFVQKLVLFHKSYSVFVCIFSHFVISAKGIKMKNGTKVA